VYFNEKQKSNRRLLVNVVEPKNFRQSASKVCNLQSALRFHHLFLIVFIFAFSDKSFHHKLTDSWETIIFKDENE